jgi:hypothetical protein
VISTLLSEVFPLFLSGIRQYLFVFLSVLGEFLLFEESLFEEEILEL